jgi:hypothetical protein
MLNDEKHFVDSLCYDAAPIKMELTCQVCPALVRLTLFHGTKLKDWNESTMNPTTHYMHSVSKSKVRLLA